MKARLIFLITFLFTLVLWSQKHPDPKSYIAYRVDEKIEIDGKDSEIKK